MLPRTRWRLSNLIIPEIPVFQQQDHNDTRAELGEALQKRPYARPQLVVYGPVAGLTGGMSNMAFLDMASMTMANCNPSLQMCP